MSPYLLKFKYPLFKKQDIGRVYKMKMFVPLIGGLSESPSCLGSYGLYGCIKKLDIENIRFDFWKKWLLKGL